MITTICLSCGRFDLLARSLESFKRSMPVPTQLIVYDDSMFKAGQAGALDHLVKMGLQTGSPYIMFLEDDWVFNEDTNWYYQSLKILESHPEVMLIGLSLTYSLRSFMPYEELCGINIRKHDPWRLSDKHGQWNGWISSPRLMRRSDVESLLPFSNYMAEEVYDQQVWRPMYDKGRRSIWLNTQYVFHIGDGRSLFPTGDRLPVEQRTWLKAHS